MRLATSAKVAPAWRTNARKVSDGPIFLPQRVPAVDHQGRPGHVARGVAGQVHRERPEILRLAEVAQRDVARNRSITSGWVSDQRRFGSVMKPPGRMALTVILCRPVGGDRAVNCSIAAFAVS